MKANIYHDFFRRLLCPRLYRDHKKIIELLTRSAAAGEILKNENDKLKDANERLLNVYQESIKQLKGTRKQRRNFIKKA